MVKRKRNIIKGLKNPFKSKTIRTYTINGKKVRGRAYTSLYTMPLSEMERYYVWGSNIYSIVPPKGRDGVFKKHILVVDTPKRKKYITFKKRMTKANKVKLSPTTKKFIKYTKKKLNRLNTAYVNNFKKIKRG